MKNKHLSIIAFIIVICTITYIIFRNEISWNNSDKLYALCYVKDFDSYGRGGYIDKYTFHINNTEYTGSKGTVSVNQNTYYLIRFVSDDPLFNRLLNNIPINPNLLTPQPPSGWTECPINEDGTIKEKYKRSNDPWYLKKSRYVVGEAMDTSMRYIYRFKWRYASVPNVEIGKHYMLKINADDLKQYELASTVPIDTAKLQIQTNGGWEECPVGEDGRIRSEFIRK